MVNKANADGYYMVKLTRDNHPTTVRIHRVVAETFILNPNNLPEVNHIDCDRQNNHVDNLEWIDHLNNVRHSSEQGHYKVHDGVKNGRARGIMLYDNNHNFIKKFDLIADCAQYFIDNHFSNGNVNTVRGYIIYRIYRLIAQ